MKIDSQLEEVFDVCRQNLVPQTRLTRKPYLCAMVGLVGSGKTNVAHELANFIGATIVESDEVRVQLRKVGLSFDHVASLVAKLTRQAFAAGNNVILDADFTPVPKHNFARELAGEQGQTPYFIHTVCDYDVMVGRVIIREFKDSPDDFFGGASTIWPGQGPEKGRVVKLREMWRRTPHHYQWSEKGGGTWVPRSFDFTHAQIDTTHSHAWLKTFGAVMKEMFDWKK